MDNKILIWPHHLALFTKPYSTPLVSTHLDSSFSVPCEASPNLEGQVRTNMTASRAMVRAMSGGRLRKRLLARVAYGFAYEYALARCGHERGKV